MAFPRSPGTRRRLLALAAGPAVLGTPHAGAQAEWPVAPLRVIVPAPAGSGTDLNARMIGERLAQGVGVSARRRTGEDRGRMT